MESKNAHEWTPKMTKPNPRGALEARFNRQLTWLILHALGGRHHSCGTAWDFHPISAVCWFDFVKNVYKGVYSKMERGAKTAISLTCAQKY
jgi:hypothetical protein